MVLLLSGSRGIFIGEATIRPALQPAAAPDVLRLAVDRVWRCLYDLARKVESVPVTEVQ